MIVANTRWALKERWLTGHGHHGKACAESASAAMRTRLAELLGSSDNNDADLLNRDSLRKVFMAVHTDLSTNLDVKFSGTTATVALLSDALLRVAWVGDSRAILGSIGSQIEVLELSVDHRPSLPAEAERIERAGGRIMAKPAGHVAGGDAPLRVWHASMDMPGLMITRSIGDGFSRTLGVSCVPALTIVELEPMDRFLVVGSDGLWDVMTNDEVSYGRAGHKHTWPGGSLVYMAWRVVVATTTSMYCLVGH